MPSRTDPGRADLEAEVIRCKREGLSQRETAAELGVSHQTVGRYLRSGLDRVVAPEVGELRTASYARLTSLLPAQEKRAVKGDHRAAAAVVRIDESIRKLYGLDAPEPIGLVLERRTDDLGQLVADALSEALGGVVGALGLAPHEARWRVELEQHGRDLAQWALSEREAPRPVAPVRPAPPAERVAVAELMPGPGWSGTDEEQELRRLMSRIVDAEIVDDGDMEASA
jgi:transcriptional regulator with XRE-family HTH domain